MIRIEKVDVNKVRWTVVGGSIMTEDHFLWLTPNGRERKLQKSVALNVGDVVGKHIVKLHNESLQERKQIAVP